MRDVSPGAFRVTADMVVAAMNLLDPPFDRDRYHCDRVLHCMRDPAGFAPSKAKRLPPEPQPRTFAELLAQRCDLSDLWWLAYTLCSVDGEIARRFEIFLADFSAMNATARLSYADVSSGLSLQRRMNPFDRALVVARLVNVMSVAEPSPFYAVPSAKARAFAIPKPIKLEPSKTAGPR